jgi:hypothetical protein
MLHQVSPRCGHHQRPAEEPGFLRHRVVVCNEVVQQTLCRRAWRSHASILDVLACGAHDQRRSICEVGAIASCCARRCPRKSAAHCLRHLSAGSDRRRCGAEVVRRTHTQAVAVGHDHQPAAVPRQLPAHSLHPLGVDPRRRLVEIPQGELDDPLGWRAVVAELGTYPRPLRLNISSDKNRRYIGKSQSKRPPERTQRTPHRSR